MSRKIPQDREIKSERLTIAVTPSIARGVAALAEINGVTISELVTGALAALVQNHSAVISSFVADKERLLSSYEGKVTLDAAYSIPIEEGDTVAKN